MKYWSKLHENWWNDRYWLYGLICMGKHFQCKVNGKLKTLVQITWNIGLNCMKIGRMIDIGYINTQTHSRSYSSSRSYYISRLRYTTINDKVTKNSLTSPETRPLVSSHRMSPYWTPGVQSLGQTPGPTKITRKYWILHKHVTTWQIIQD